MVWILLATSLQAANGFYTQRLEKMAKVLNLSASSPTGEKYANGKLLRIRTNTYGDISHIGYKLFNDEIMQLHGESPVFDFIERYMLELDMRLDGRSPLERMNIDQVVISKGNLQMLRAIDTNTEEKSVSGDMDSEGKESRNYLPCRLSVANRCQCRRTGKHDETRR